MSLVSETQKAIKAADHLTDEDAGAIAVLLTLARKIDTEAELRELALRYAEEHDQKPPHVDNVSIPTYLKYADALGLTPNGREKLKSKPAAGKKEAGDDDDNNPTGNVSPFQARRERARNRRPA